MTHSSTFCFAARDLNLVRNTYFKTKYVLNETYVNNPNKHYILFIISPANEVGGRRL